MTVETLAGHPKTLTRRAEHDERREERVHAGVSAEGRLVLGRFAWHPLFPPVYDELIAMPLWDGAMRPRSCKLPNQTKSVYPGGQP